MTKYVVLTLLIALVLPATLRAQTQETRVQALSVEESDVGWPLAVSVLEGNPSLTLAQPSQSEGDIVFGAELERIVNAYRVSQGLPALRIHARLRDATAIHNVYMETIQQLCHACPNEGSTSDQMIRAGYQPNPYAWGQVAGINYETPAQMLEGWQTSAGHNRAILNPAYIHFGCAALTGDWAWLWTCDLAAGGNDSPVEDGSAVGPLTPTPTSTPQPTQWLPPTRTPLPTAQYTPPPVPATSTVQPTPTRWLPPTRTPFPTTQRCEWRFFGWQIGWRCV
jgi:uncharacterized protein YkwD